MFAIMADEARDGHTEQLAICVRYVTEGTIKERFLSLTELRSFDAKSITEALERKLQEEGIAQLKCVAQTYDGAAVMSEAAGGVQYIFRERHPEAIYVHCYAHWGLSPPKMKILESPLGSTKRWIFKSVWNI